MNDRSKIHYRYVISYLVVAIIALASIKWVDIPNLVEYISFGLTTSSLLLAILAILYTIFSRESLSALNLELSRAAKQVTRASEKIEESHRKLQDDFQVIPTKLDSMGRGLEDVQSLIKNGSTKQIQLTGPDDPGGETNTRPLSSEQVDQFLRRSPSRGLEVLLASFLSFETKTAFHFSDLSTEWDEEDSAYSYWLAYFIAAHAIGVFEYEFDARHRYRVTWIDNRLRESIFEEIQRELREMAEVLGFEEDEEVTRKRFSKTFDAICSYFGKDWEF